MTLSELIAVIREDYLDDTFSGWQSASQEERDDQFLWSDASLLRYLTEAQRQATNRTDFIYDDSSSITRVTLRNGVNEYKISPFITRIERVSFNGNTVKHISKEERDRFMPQWRSETGIGDSQAYYMIRGRKMYVYPIPDALDAGGVINFDVYRMPLDPLGSESDELEIPEEYHRDLVWWVLYEAYSKQDADTYDKEKGLRYLAQFNDVFGPYVPSTVRLNQFQEPENLVVRGVDYMGGSRLNQLNDTEPQW